MQHPTHFILLFACATAVATPSQCDTSFEGAGESRVGSPRDSPVKVCKPTEDLNRRTTKDSAQPMQDCPSQAN